MEYKRRGRRCWDGRCSPRGRGGGAVFKRKLQPKRGLQGAAAMGLVVQGTKEASQAGRTRADPPNHHPTRLPSCWAESQFLGRAPSAGDDGTWSPRKPRPSRWLSPAPPARLERRASFSPGGGRGESPHRDVAMDTDRPAPGRPGQELAAQLVRAGAGDAEALVAAVEDGLEQPQLPPQQRAPRPRPRRRARPRPARPRALHRPIERPAAAPGPPASPHTARWRPGRARSRK